jgi:hypothetical protein
MAAMVALSRTSFAERSEAIPTLPGWSLIQQEAGRYEATRDDDVRLDGEPTVRLRSGPSPRLIASVAQKAAAAEYGGKRVRISASVRVAAPKGHAGLSVSIMEGRRPLWFESTEDRSPRGTADWTPLELVVDVPRTAQSISYGMFLNGEGTSWCGPIRVEIVGADVAFTTMNGGRLRNSDFEGSLAGWFQGGSGKREYVSRTVSDVRHGGRRGLMLTLGPDGDAATYGTVAQFFDARPYAGKRVRASIWLRSKGVTKRGDFWVRCRALGAPGDTSGPKAANAAVGPTSDWGEYVAVFDVPESSSQIDFGVGLSGPGTLWADDASFELVASDTPLRDAGLATP